MINAKFRTVVASRKGEKITEAFNCVCNVLFL